MLPTQTWWAISIACSFAYEYMILKRDTFFVLSFFGKWIRAVRLYTTSENLVIQSCALTDFWKMYVPLIYHPLPQAFHSQTERISKAVEQKEDYENFVHSVNQKDTPLCPNAGMLFSLKPSNKCLCLYPCK